jgi:predicted membrane-bound spermidine synthase
MLYASDLIGASLGCLLVLGGLEIFDAPSLVILCAAIGMLAALIFARGNAIFKPRRLSWVILAILLIIAAVNSTTSYGIRPYVVKGLLQDPSDYFLEKWNSFSRVIVSKKTEGEPQFWGISPRANINRIIPQYGMSIDGGAFTTLRRFQSLDDIDHLKYDITNAVHYLRPAGDACVIGVGGGRDIQSAILFGHDNITGIDLNPIFIQLLQDQFREFAGISDRENVNLIVDEARSYLSRSRKKYSVIQMSMTDTFAATGAGAYSLSENGLYTLEGWKIFLDRLADNGIFTVSRWHNPRNLGETGRVVSLAVATLLGSGKKDPSAHIAMITTANLSTLLLSKEPFNIDDISALENYVAEMGFDAAILPGRQPSHDALRRIISAGSLDQLESAVSDEILDFSPSTDDNPYFFNMLRLNHLRSFNWPGPGVMRGNLAAHITLIGLIISLLAVSLWAIALPLWLRSKSEKAKNKKSSILWSGATYFSLIGAGFMFAEIGLIQRLSVFLGHPIYALGILLFTIIASTGLGSFFSERLPLTRPPWIYIYPPAIAIAVIAVRFALPAIASSMGESPILNRAIVSVLLIAPVGLLLGVCFPTGMKLVRLARFAETPWFWALNGIFGVLSSALAVFLAIHIGISANFYISAACYTCLLVCIPGMYKISHQISAKPD